MIGIDTNVLVRYLAQDDAKQSAQASRFVGELSADAPGFISLVTLVELVWVMQGPYAASRKEIAAILGLLLRTEELVIENVEVVFAALRVFESSKAGFADCLIERSAARAGCTHTVSFDQAAIKTAGMRSLT